MNLIAAGPHVFVVTRWFAALLAILALVVILRVAHIVVVKAQGPAQDTDPHAKKRRGGIKALVIGRDGRASTSKLQVVLWTFGVFFALVFLLSWGRSWGCSHASLSDGQQRQCAQASSARGTFDRVTSHPLQPAYYVLLGFPLAAAVAAKALTVGKLADGSITKPDVDHDKVGPAQSLSEIVSNDQGDTDLMDFQYFSFNLLTLAFFAIEFLTKPASGLPDLPPTLIALAGLSAATYTTKKALETTTPATVTAVIPQHLPLAVPKRLIIVGTNFGSRAGESPKSKVLLDGVELQVESWESGRIEASVTQGVVEAHPGAKGDAVKGDLVVLGEEGPPSAPFTVDLLIP